MTKTATAPYDVAEHLRTREEVAAYLEVSIEESEGDAAFVAKALGDIARAKRLTPRTVAFALQAAEDRRAHQQQD